MAQHFNRKSGLSESIPLGSFNSMFNFTGSWKIDSASARALATDGFFIPLYTVRLATSGLTLRDEVKRAVPRNWEPASLARWGAQFPHFIFI